MSFLFLSHILPHDSVSLKWSYNVKSAKSVLFFILHKTEISDISCTELWSDSMLRHTDNVESDRNSNVLLSVLFSFMSTFLLPILFLFLFVSFLFDIDIVCSLHRVCHWSTLNCMLPCRTQLLRRRYRRLQAPCVVAPDASPQRNHSNHIRNVFTFSFLTLFRHAQGNRR